MFFRKVLLNYTDLKPHHKGLAGDNSQVSLVVALLCVQGVL